MWQHLATHLLHNADLSGVHTGGVGLARGRNGAEIGRLLCCDAMRCTKCDLRVVSFDHRAWAAGCEYLFFRWVQMCEPGLLGEVHIYALAVHF